MWLHLEGISYFIFIGEFWLTAENAVHYIRKIVVLS